jgi:hypothetical protein
MKTLQIALLFSYAPLCAQPAATASRILIPFVGCPSFGQVDKLEAPKGTGKLLALGKQHSEALAYYKSADGISVLAPRGWYCQGSSGSGGAALFLSPTPIVSNSSGWQGLDGGVIEVNDISGENSGHYEIAAAIARVFPVYRRFARNELRDSDLPFPSGPYPTDTLKYLSNTTVEYTTPPQSEGLGNVNSYIGKNDIPITGAAVLIDYPPNPRGKIPHLILLSVRLPHDLAWLAPTIIRYVERNPTGAEK